MSHSMKIKRNLPDAPEPTRATFHRNKIDGYGKFITVLPSEYHPRPAPIPKPRPKKPPKPKETKEQVKVKQAARASKARWWNEERITTLIKLHREGITYVNIAEQMGTTRGAITSQVKRLIDRGLLSPREERDTWLPEDLDRLMELRAEGKTFGEIGDILGRKPKVCNEMWRRQNAKRNSMRSLFS